MTEKKDSRRSFLKKAAIGTVSVVGTAAVAKKVVDAAARQDAGGSDSHYLGSGDRSLAGREYVEMSQAEKSSQIRMLTDNYKYDTV
ncbi:MAG: twin-arginine translocation signal domain-containing protein [bacterium]|nr:twin-arginine translocation signal domain-containing protein [bacterium]